MDLYSYVSRRRAVVAAIIIIFMIGLRTISRLQYQSFSRVVSYTESWLAVSNILNSLSSHISFAYNVYSKFC
jgi:hypothetical protein